MPDKFDILNTIPVPIIAVNDKLELLAANNRANTVFASANNAETIEQIVADEHLKLAMQAALKTGEEVAKVIVGKIRSGTEYKVYIRNLSPQYGLDDVALIATFEDQSYFKDAKMMRSDFVANVSHEIRSPLTAISGFVETLHGPAQSDPAALSLFLGLMEKEVTRMTNLVSDLLSLSQVEAKERRALEKTADPNKIIRQAFESGQAFAQKIGKTVALQGAGDLPNILGKDDDLVRVFINLIENAAAYSFENSEIRVLAAVEAAPNPLGRPAISIAITDEGEGIPASEIPRLTERFYRVDKSRSRNAGGTGLGLAIVKHILNRHRGILLINSTLGQGSEFKVYLPMA